MNGLDLFSGIGGIGIALEPWVRTVAYCERDRYAQGVLLSRMRSGDIDRAPIWDDVTTLRAEMLPRIDIIFGGFPCQDLSVAGAGKGLAGERSGLFFEIVRLARECEPRFIFLENVPAIRTRGGERVVKELAKIGYDCRWTTLSAAAVGAPHKRERWFLLAHANSVRQLSAQGQYDRISNGCKNVAHAKSDGLESNRNPRGIGKGISSKEFPMSSVDGGNAFSPDLWAVEPAVGRVVNGISNRVDRIKCLGNSVVPLQVRTAFQKLAGLTI
jgi:DNA (cytosine-5)-methyltransferase 1